MEGIVKGWFSLGDFWVLVAPSKRGIIPIGVIGSDHYFDAIMPHVLWFPWATKRTKLECIARFVENMRRSHTVIIFSEYRHEEFWKWLGYLGLIAKACRLENVYGDQSCFVWKSVR